MKVVAAERNVWIDFLRVASAVWIIGVWHPVGYSAIRDMAINPLTARVTVLALALFVFLSGYLLGSSLKDLKSFYVRRFWRIYVPFAIATLVFMVMNIGDRQPLIKGLFLVGILDEPAAVTLWFINMIFLFYLVAPLLLAAKQRSTEALVLIALLCEIALLGVDLTLTHTDARIAIYFPAFSLGVWIAGRQVPGRAILPIGLAAVVAVASTLNVATEDVEASLLILPWATFSSLFVVLAVQRRNIRMSAPLAAWVERAAVASFFAYLIHRPAYKVLQTLSTTIGVDPLPLIVLVGLPVTFFAAYYLQVGYEAVLKRKSTKSPPIETPTS